MKSTPQIAEGRAAVSIEQVPLFPTDPPAHRSLGRSDKSWIGRGTISRVPASISAVIDANLPYQFCIDGAFGLKTYQLAVAPFFVLIGFAAVLAQAPASDASLTTNPAYQKNCAKCHGKTAEGRTFAGPSLISKKAAATGTEDLRNIIANGKGRMPKFASKLTPEEIDALVRQVQTLNGK
jgi:mono/diheme cytochrome c family protein